MVASVFAASRCASVQRVAERATSGLSTPLPAVADVPELPCADPDAGSLALAVESTAIPAGAGGIAATVPSGLCANVALNRSAELTALSPKWSAALPH